MERIEERRRELASGEEFADLVLAPGGVAARASQGPAGFVADMSAGCGWISIPPVWGRFLMRLLRELTPRSCVELGTGFGISAAYQAAALTLSGMGRLTTLEVSRECVTVAERGLSELGLDQRVDLQLGEIGETLQGVMQRVAPVDYALIDADHTEQATLGHFRTMLPHLSDGAVVLLDDINWTSEMKRAWQTIARDEQVSLAVGLGRVGIAAIAATRA
jgi:predicted O-methyltransferase YrrM